MTARLLPNLPADTYHADQLGDQPTLSASIAKILIDQSPAHAYAQHPRLNPAFEKKAEDKFDVGVAAHKLLLEGESVIEVIVADNFKTKVAREHRDEARAHGRIPLLAKDADQVVAMAAAIRVQLADYDERYFLDGAPERTIVWDENGVPCRARLDWLHKPELGSVAYVQDLKTTSRSANGWEKRPLYDHGCDIQCALYHRALRALGCDRIEWRWVVVETSAPFALRVIRPSAALLALGDAKVDKALTIWKRCLDTGEWPAYPREVVEAELPAYIESAWLEREAREEAMAA